MDKKVKLLNSISSICIKEIFYSKRSSQQCRSTAIEESNVTFLSTSRLVLRETHTELFTLQFSNTQSMRCGQYFVAYTKNLKCVFSIGHIYDI